VFVGGILVAVAGAASVMLFLSLGKPDKTDHAGRASSTTHDIAATKPTPPRPEPVVAAVKPEQGMADPGAGSSGSADAESVADLNAGSAGSGSKAGSSAKAGSSPIAPPVAQAAKPPVAVARGPAQTGSTNATKETTDPAVQDQLAQAEQELAKGNVDMAWRLANTIINTGHGAARAQAIGIHGVIECTRNNSAEGAGIDLRRLGGGGPARDRILAACHARDMLVEEH